MLPAGGAGASCQVVGVLDDADAVLAAAAEVAAGVVHVGDTAADEDSCGADEFVDAVPSP